MIRLITTLVLSSSPDAGEYRGTLDRELIMKGIRAQMPTARRCFEEPGGKLVVRFVIGPDGRVTESELAEPTTCSNKTVSCVLEAMKGVKTAPPLGGSVLVTYPFIIRMSGL